MAKPENQIVRLASEHVFNLFREPEGTTAVAFHGFKHSRDVVSAAKEIAKGSDLDANDTRVVLLAAWFVDAAYAIAPDGGRSDGAELARDFLVRNRQPQSLVEAVTACIEAAPSPGHGETLHEVLHDALLSPLADKDFVRKAELYRLEQDRRTGKRFADAEWTERCIGFIEAHPYRTRYAQLEFARDREANLVRLHKRLRKQQEKTALEKSGEATKLAKGAGKTVENVFYFLTKMTVQLLVLADRRTATMIHVNALMISAVLTLLVRKLDTQRYLLAPTLVLLAVNVIVIFIAVWSMRQGRGGRARSVSRDPRGDAAVVFAIDADVSLEQYQEAMSVIAEDGAALQKTMVEQLYAGRSVLNQRTRGLRFTYDAFIYGLAFSLAVFAFVLVRR
jgi:Family of unknown function (DUF5706)